MKELMIPPDDPSLMKVFDPYTIQGMINALTFFARGAGGVMEESTDIYGKTFVAKMEGTKIALRPTPSGLSTMSVTINVELVATTRKTESSLTIHNPDKVELKEAGTGQAILKFYARDPSAILTITATEDGVLYTNLKVTDLRHPDRVHGAEIHYEE